MFLSFGLSVGGRIHSFRFNVGLLVWTQKPNPSQPHHVPVGLTDSPRYVLPGDHENCPQRSGSQEHPSPEYGTGRILYDVWIDNVWCMDNIRSR